MPTPHVQLYMISYDDASVAAVRPPFQPLDNREGPAGWFELYPILRYLETNELNEETWYGFVSPKFSSKAMVTSADVMQIIEADPNAEVALFSSQWLDILYFKNAWTQADHFHPGVIDCFRAFLETREIEFDPSKPVGTFATTVFSNYIVAKPAFWDAWRKIARAYFDYVEEGGEERRDNLKSNHGGMSDYRIKTFVQERLSCWVLEEGDFRVVHAPYSWLPQTGLSGRMRVVIVAGCIAASHAWKRMARQRIPGAFAVHRLLNRVMGTVIRRLSTPG